MKSWMFSLGRAPVAFRSDLWWPQYEDNNTIHLFLSRVAGYLCLQSNMKPYESHKKRPWKIWKRYIGIGWTSSSEPPGTQRGGLGVTAGAHPASPSSQVSKMSPGRQMAGWIWDRDLWELMTLAINLVFTVNLLVFTVNLLALFNFILELGFGFYDDSCTVLNIKMMFGVIFDGITNPNCCLTVLTPDPHV